MITDAQATLVAEAIHARLGEAAIAAVLLRAREAETRGDAIRGADWMSIARKLTPDEAD
ncbi:MAG: hypothetical protein RID91_14430 [Azospirillaceae bacterium]